MATVYVGSARIDERGKATGGAAGDQTGGEVATQAWYKHALGWAVIRAKDGAARLKIAAAMRNACANPKIGYDQNQRDSLYNAVKSLGFDPSKATALTECDCSSLVRVCCCYAGIMVGNIRTATEPSILKATGKFDVLTDPMYTDHPERLMEGDILCTKTSGHTVVVLNDGYLAHVAVSPSTVYYTVVKGDSLARIGKRYGVSWPSIAKLNNIKLPYIIHPGQRLRIK